METRKLLEKLHTAYSGRNCFAVLKDYKDGKERTPFYISSGTFHLASFMTIEQYDNFVNTFRVDIDKESKDVKTDSYGNEIILYNVLNNFYSAYFWKISDIPKGCKKIKALSNGSIVECYFIKNGIDIIFFRPNPNAKEVYRPLETNEHIKFQRQNGIY